VTEYGVARLLDKNHRQRAEELISIAHPDFRAELRKEALELWGELSI
jgi:4-hydroxybutyrate CoA-transferase